MGDSEAVGGMIFGDLSCRKCPDRRYVSSSDRLRCQQRTTPDITFRSDPLERVWA
jgi:hypothetical protein